jgi:hypothetical protein
MKYTAPILEACIARVHAEALHEKALQGKPLPDFSPEVAAQRRDRRLVNQKAKWVEKAKGAAR